MSKTHSDILVLLLAVAIVLLAYIAWGSGERADGASPDPEPQQASNDPREAIPLNDEQMQFALAQMRGFLEAIEDLEAAELEGNTGAMARLAGAHGPGKEQPPQGFRDRLPDTFQAMSGGTRKSFAAMERHLSDGDLEGYRAERLEALRTCNTCHASYRFVSETRSTPRQP
ncbi:hypothetical protein [Erythrobacter sp. HL-111]|uniref:hypothetical protein n=1 Tax=Erythrobacter sp. HL-111 TaxID=1798193 RepID=UPI0006DA339D|nr:hypothetical protein [Erythrobacter sp. HL-111]KPP94434.1 MAG: monoheme cytochrome c [Erythrobacteraceae bacterium HL-111]SDS56684.1 hypothetical protein SAMN04515621_1802 [Erythrobacter sp. HL-111]